MRSKLDEPMHIGQVMIDYLDQLEQQATPPGGLFRTQEQAAPCPKR